MEQTFLLCACLDYSGAFHAPFDQDLKFRNFIEAEYASMVFLVSLINELMVCFLWNYYDLIWRERYALFFGKKGGFSADKQQNFVVIMKLP